jgi:parvulin-like peptidyl-prolyl isomerase
MRSRTFRCLDRGLRAAAILGLLAAGQAAAEGEDGERIAATVDGEAITVDEVERRVRAGLGDREIAEGARPAVAARALDLLVGQRLVERHLRALKRAPSAAELDAALAAIKEAALAREATWEAYLAKEGMTEEALRRETAWRLAWQRHLDAALSDDVRREYFESHQREFDGTELKVSHILLRVAEPRTEEAVAAALARAAELRRQVAAGKVTFAAAAEKHSAGPSRRKGGDLGFIPRRGRMVEEFSRAAFALEPGETSEPVVTVFGVHLIHCTEVRPGMRTFEEAREELEPHAIQHLFEGLVAELQPKAKIAFTGASPYLDAATGRVAGGE